MLKIVCLYEDGRVFLKEDVARSFSLRCDIVVKIKKM